jgi:hypothetical protein
VKSKQAKLMGVLIGALIMAVLLIAPVVSADSFGPGSPDLTSVAQATTYSFFNARVLTTSTPLAYSSLQSRAVYWAVADVFVTADVSGTDTITVTPQYSADYINWTDATYTFVTWNVSGTATLNTRTYQVVLNSDSTSFMRVPIAGEYLRFKADNGGTVTLTVKATMKNGTR